MPASRKIQARCFSYTLDPGSQSYAAGVTSLQTMLPGITHGSLVASRWKLPPKAGNVEPGIRFTWSDGSTTTRKNTISASLAESRELVFFDKNSLFVKKLEMIADNVSGSPETQDLDSFQVEGEQW